MGKAEAGTPKAIGKQLKAKGLQKLRWYCQMCQKQCRDENGFQNHLQSESHRRMMEHFGDDPNGYIEDFSQQFEKDFLEHVASTHRNKPIHANQAYNEFIRNRHHIHMNSTKWTTLTEFVQDLGRRGVCKVEETSRGWYITYKPRDYQEELRDRMHKRKQREEEAEEHRQERAIRQQVNEARRAAGALAQPSEATELQSDQKQGAIALSLSNSKSNKRAKLTQENNRLNILAEEMHDADKRAHLQSEAEHSVPSSSDHATDREPRAQTWLHEGIIVKVLARQLPDYYQKKGQVLRVHDDGLIADIKMQSTSDVLRVDSSQLETVIPKPGNGVLILRGRHAGKHACLTSVDTASMKARVSVDSANGEEAEYGLDDISKLV